MNINLKLTVFAMLLATSNLLAQSQMSLETNLVKMPEDEVKIRVATAPGSKGGSSKADDLAGPSGISAPVVSSFRPLVSEADHTIGGFSPASLKRSSTDPVVSALPTASSQSASQPIAAVSANANYVKNGTDEGSATAAKQAQVTGSSSSNPLKPTIGTGGVTVDFVPEPGTIALLGLAGATILAYRRKR